MNTAPGANVIKHFTVVINCHSMVTMSFCVKKQYYLGNYSGMAVNYHGICVTNVTKYNLTKNGSSIQLYFNPTKGRVKIRAVIYRGIIYNIGSKWPVL